MEPESILQADLLDIVFENRNKTYGAYELRSHYDKRLKKALLIIFASVATILGMNYWISKYPAHRHLIPVESPDSLQLKSVVLPEEKKSFQRQQVPVKRATTVQSATILIVRQPIQVNPPPLDTALDQAKIGAANIPGDKSLTGGIGQPTSGNGEPDNKTETHPGAKKETILRIAEIMPEFPGGMEALKRFLSRNLRMPENPPEPGSAVRVLARFVVDQDGNITAVSVEQSGGNDFDKEVMRVMKKMPRWKPGMQNGNRVAVYFYLPVIFKSQEAE